MNLPKLSKMRRFNEAAEDVVDYLVEVVNKGLLTEGFVIKNKDGFVMLIERADTNEAFLLTGSTGVRSYSKGVVGSFYSKYKSAVKDKRSKPVQAVDAGFFLKYLR